MSRSAPTVALFHKHSREIPFDVGTQTESDPGRTRPPPWGLAGCDAAVADAQDVETDEDAGVQLPPPDAIPVPQVK